MTSGCEDSKKILKASRVRQLLGADALANIMELKVLVIGLRGLGAEITKNIVLAGISEVDLYDPTVVAIADLGANFFFSEQEVGHTTRAEATRKELQLLNPDVAVRVVDEGQLKPEVLLNYSVIVVTELLLPLSRLQALNEATRKRQSAPRGVAFVLALSYGVAGSVFVDFGDKHTITDTNGIPTVSSYLLDITNANPGMVTVQPGSWHGLMDDDFVVFRDIDSMVELNTLPPVRVSLINHSCFTIDCDTTHFPPFVGTGIVESAKVPVIQSFRPLSMAFEEPQCSPMDPTPVADFSGIDRPGLVHLALRALLQFHEKTQTLPRLNCEEDAAICFTLAEEINAAMQKTGKPFLPALDRKSLMQVFTLARAEITAMTAFIGGVATQEALKIVGKYSPLRQWLHYDILESVPQNTPVDRTLRSSRYDDYIAVYGQDVLTRLAQLKPFLVGAGALGCELIKGLALMGVGTEGMLYVTDNDHIELSNLNRQFLFREEDIKKPKVHTALAAGRRINPALRFTAYQELVSPTTENIFTEDFWDSLSLVLGGVDNMQARRYINSKCLWHRKTYLDSATLGTNCNNHSILSGKTETLDRLPDPTEEAGIPQCTLRNFPSRLEHTIEWAKAQFEDWFSKSGQMIKKFLKNPKGWLETTKQSSSAKGLIMSLAQIRDIVALRNAKSIPKCAVAARELFQKLFYNEIQQLLVVYPPGALNDHGLPFWSGLKRMPQPLDYNAGDPLHDLFVKSYVRLLWAIFGFDFKPQDDAVIATMAQGAVCAPFEFDSELEIPATEEAIAELARKQAGQFSPENALTIDALFRTILDEVKGWKGDEVTFIQFEKDDDLIIDFIHAAANLRARNYKLKECDRVQTQFVAGRIIPAMATSTALIVGAVLGELAKVVQGFADLFRYKNLYINLAANVYMVGNPNPVSPFQGVEYDPNYGRGTAPIAGNYTCWDRIEVRGSKTFRELCKQMEEEHKVDVRTVLFDGKTLFYKNGRSKTQIDNKIEARYEELLGNKLPPHQRSLRLQLIASNIGANTNAILPDIRYVLPSS